MRMPQIHLKRRFVHITAGVLGFILLLFALAAWQVPQLTRRALMQDVAALLGREVQAGKITFNPFTLTLRVHDLAVKQPHSAQPLLSVTEIGVGAAWHSIFWLAPVIDTLEVREPRFTLVREGPLQFNFSDIYERIAARSAHTPPAPQKKHGVPRFSLNNMRLENGSITLDDKVTHRHQTIDEINLGIPFISNFGYATRVDVLPRFHARINGSTLDLHGTALPFAQVPRSTLDIVFDGLALDKWADAWAVPLPVKLNRGLLDSNLQLVFEQPKNDKAKLHITGGVRLRELDLRQASGESLLAWQALAINGLDVLPLERKASVAEVTWFDPVVAVRQEVDQRLNWMNVLHGFQGLFAQVRSVGPAGLPRANKEKRKDKDDVTQRESVPGVTSADQKTSSQLARAEDDKLERAEGTKLATDKAAALAWRLSLEKVAIQNGQVRLRAPAVDLNYELARLAVRVQHVQWPQPKDKPIVMQLSAANPDGANLKATGGGLIQPVALNLDLQANRFPLAPFAGIVRSRTPIRLLEGTVSLASKLSAQDAHGTIAGQASDLNVVLSHISVRDESLKTPAKLGLKALTLGIDKLALGPDVSTFTLNGTGLLGEGSLASQGSFSVKPLAAKAQVDLEGLNVMALAPYVASRLNATLRSAKLTVKGRAAFAAAQGNTPMKAAWQGEIDTQNLDLKDSVNKVDFLSWKQLRLRAMDVALVGKQPNINLGDILLDDFYGNILLNQQGRLNVRDLIITPGKVQGSITQDKPTQINDTQAHAKDKQALAQNQAQPQATPTQMNSASRQAPPAKGASQQASSAQTKGASEQTPPTATPRASLPPIAMHSITLKRGRATFTDNFIQPHYRAKLTEIEGTVSAVSSQAPDPANVMLTAQLSRTTPLLLSGTVNPFDQFLTLDLKASAQGVELPRFTTYSVKYVGYPLTRGKLFFELGYRIKNRVLEANNHIQFNQLDFGQEVPSPTATRLPVMLAVALLKDRNNNIDLNLPVSGSLNDPHFSIGGVVWEVVSNFIIKAATSPFSLLTAAFGGGEELSFIQFVPGSAELDPAAITKLKKLATALTERPALKMDILGYVDPASDGAALRQAWVEAQIQTAQANATGKSVQSIRADHAPLSAEDRAKYLEDAYDNTEIANKPRNFLGIAKSVPPDQMEAAMRQAAPVGEAQLRNLAKERAVAAYKQFQQNQAPIDRIFLVPPSPEVGTEKSNQGAKVIFSLKR